MRERRERRETGEPIATLVRTAVAFVATLVAATLFAGVVGGALRLAHHAAFGIGPGPGRGVVAAPFEFGFGVPLPTVLLWLAVLLAPFAAGYLLYSLLLAVARRPDAASDDRERGGRTDTRSGPGSAT